MDFPGPAPLRLSAREAGPSGRGPGLPGGGSEEGREDGIEEGCGERSDKPVSAEEE